MLLISVRFIFCFSVFLYLSLYVHAINCLSEPDVNIILLLERLDIDIRNDSSTVEHVIHLVLLVVHHVFVALDVLDGEGEQVVYAILLGDILLNLTA